MIQIDETRFKAAYEGRRQPAHGVTLVAFLGKAKSLPFVNVVKLAQQTVRSELGKHDLAAYFEDYPMPDIHATLIGLEGVRRKANRIINDNLTARLAGLVGKGAVPPTDLDALLEFFQRGYSSFDVQIGGF